MDVFSSVSSSSFPEPVQFKNPSSRIFEHRCERRVFLATASVENLAKDSARRPLSYLVSRQSLLLSTVISCLFRSGQRVSIRRSSPILSPDQCGQSVARVACPPELYGIYVLPFTPCLCVTATPVLPRLCFEILSKI